MVIFNSYVKLPEGSLFWDSCVAPPLILLVAASTSAGLLRERAFGFGSKCGAARS